MVGRTGGQAARQKHMMDEASFVVFPSFPSHHPCELGTTETERRKGVGGGGREQLLLRCPTRSKRSGGDEENSPAAVGFFTCQGDVWAGPWVDYKM